MRRLWLALTESPRSKASPSPVEPPALGDCERKVFTYDAVAAAAVDWASRTAFTNFTPMPPTSPIPLPDVDIDEPVAVIPTASVAPLEDEPDGERINIFTVRAKNSDGAVNAFTGDMRQRVLRNPLTYAATAFSLGFLIARVLR
jgi:hypothetical protein